MRSTDSSIDKTRILLVEDENIIAMDLRTRLTRLGYAVVALVPSGEEALQKAEELAPDVVLMDIVLKGKLDGVQTAEQVRSRFGIPVIYLTAHSDDNTLQRVALTEPFGYLLKPFEDGELHTTIEIALYRHSMERKLQESEARFRSLIENSNDIIAILDEDQVIRYVSSSATRVLGHPTQEMVTKSLFEYVAPQEAIFISDAFQKALQQPQVSLPLPEFMLRHNDGSWRSMTGQVTNLLTSPAVKGIVLNCHDMTERKRADEALKRHDREMAALYETSLEINSQPDVSTLLRAIVRRAAELLGTRMGGLYLLRPDAQALELVVGYNLPHDYTGATLRIGEGLAGRVARSGKLMMVEDYVHWEGRVERYADGSFRRILSVPLKTGNQTIGVITVQDEQAGLFDEDAIRLVSLFADQAAIAVQNARLVEALRQQAIELQARNEELDAFAHTVAHDLKNPLSLIMGFAEVVTAEADQLSDEQHYTLQDIMRNARKMDNIIEALLLLAGVRKQEIEPQPLTMADIVAEAQQRLTAMIAQYQAEIVLPTPNVWPVAWGYAPWVEEVWVNYLSNAIKYGGHPPHVELGADPLPTPPTQAGYVRFWVRDNGSGLSQEEQAQLFTPFTRLDQARAGGYGLGLSIVRRIIEKLGGQVGVESEGKPGRGSVFYFVLPTRSMPQAQSAFGAITGVSRK